MIRDVNFVNDEGDECGVTSSLRLKLFDQRLDLVLHLLVLLLLGHLALWKSWKIYTNTPDNSGLFRLPIYKLETHMLIPVGLKHIYFHGNRMS